MVKQHCRQQGFLTIVAIVVIVIFSFMGVVATYLINSSLLSNANNLAATQALYIAEAGLEKGAHLLLNDTLTSRITCTNASSNPNLTNVSFTGAKGVFTVTTGVGSQSAVAGTLKTNIDADDTAIAVTNASSYAPFGRIIIDKESIDYSTIDNDSFVYVRRGADGTVATSHTGGTKVGQYQCTLNSQAGVPNLNLLANQVGGKRSLQEAVQLPEAWAVGTTQNSSLSLIHWNKPSELLWSNASIAGNNYSLNAIYMISYADAWAVGDRTGSDYNILHWDGSYWSQIPGPGGSARDLYSIYCVNSDYCMAVGESKNILVWDGSQWARQNVSNLPGVDLNSVYCNTTNNCWAVGNTSSGEVFAFWNGSTWSRNSSRPTPANNLNGVTCTSTNNCLAVGDNRTFVKWNGVSWSTQSAASVPNVNYNKVACPASNDCWAVGNNAAIVHWNGANWLPVPSPTTVNLMSVDCRASNDCWAVGVNATILHWDGTSWVIVSGPLTSSTLKSVSSIGYHKQATSSWQEVFK